MTEIEKIHFRYSTTDDVMSFENFTKALTEVMKLVEVTDEEIEERDPDSARFRIGAKWSRDLQKQKLKKLIG